jgi:hypothetical protein
MPGVCFDSNHNLRAPLSMVNEHTCRLPWTGSWRGCRPWRGAGPGIRWWGWAPSPSWRARAPDCGAAGGQAAAVAAPPRRCRTG